MHARKTRDRTVGRTLTGLEYKPVLPSDGFGEWGRKEAMLGCREGPAPTSWSRGAPVRVAACCPAIGRRSSGADSGY